MKELTNDICAAIDQAEKNFVSKPDGGNRGILFFLVFLLVASLLVLGGLVVRDFSKKPGSSSIVKVGSPLQKDGSDHEPPVPNSMTRPWKLTFEKIGNWKFIDGKTEPPDAVKSFDGKWVSITGYMLSYDEILKMDRFILTSSSLTCCYGKKLEENHNIIVLLGPEHQVDFTPDEVCVTGVFEISSTREGPYLVSIYKLKSARVH